MAKKIVLGNKYRDRISGFEGVATGRFEYLYGCVRYALEGTKEQEFKDYTFYEQRLEEVKPPRKILPTARSGGPQPTPNRTGR
jgi:hypothetical protein